MFVCIECGHVFEEPQYWEERHGFDYGPGEEWSGCPECGSSYTRTYECDCCGEWITGKYVKTEDGYRYCSECYFEHDIGDEDN